MAVNPGRELDATVSRRLREHGIKPTPQRLAIGRLLLGEPCHRSAEQILGALREQGSRISRATVYNTLNLFTHRDVVREVAVDAGRRFYDSTTTVHHHFYNEDTGELTDIDPGDIGLPSLPELPQGTEASSVELIIRLRRKA